MIYHRIVDYLLYNYKPIQNQHKLKRIYINDRSKSIYHSLSIYDCNINCQDILYCFLIKIKANTSSYLLKYKNERVNCDHKDEFNKDCCVIL